MLDPTEALLQWLPSDAQRTIAWRIPESEAETGKTGLPLIADAMARGLYDAQEGIAEGGNWNVVRAHLRMRDWIRDAMDLASHEGLFGEFLKFYEEALIRYSTPMVNKAIEEVPAATMISLYLTLSEKEPKIPGGERDRMLALGSALGLGAKQLSLSMLHYGTEFGLFQDRDFGLTPDLKGQAGRLGPGPMQEFELVDAGYFEMLDQFLGIRREIEGDWGSLHPLVRGFEQQYEGDRWIRDQGVERIQRAVGEVEDYVTKPRH